MDSLTYFLSFSRLARRQVVFWGHAITTGITAGDYPHHDDEVKVSSSSGGSSSSSSSSSSSGGGGGGSGSSKE